MKEWPLNLFVFGLIITIIAAVFDGRRVMVCTTVGYIGGFATGMLFGADGADPGGGRTNNAWMIWTVSLLIAILVGIVWELFNKRRKRDGLL